MDIAWLNIDRLIVLHQDFALLAEATAVLTEEAAKFHQVENGDHSAATHSDEVVHKSAHFCLALLLSISDAPLTAGLVLVFRNNFSLGPEHPQATEKLVVSDPVIQWGVVRDETEKHLPKEVVLDPKHFRKVLLNRLQRQVLSCLILGLPDLLAQLFEVDDSESVEDAEDVGDVVLIDLALECLELFVLGVEPLDVLRGVHEVLFHCLDEV